MSLSESFPGGSSGDVLSDEAWSSIIGRLSLSRRQGEVVRLMFEGATESTIAAELGISAHTVHTHIDRIHKKLEVGDRVGLVMQIIREFVAVTLDPEGGLPSICARRAHGECPFGT